MFRYSSNNIFFVLFLRLFVVLILFSCCRVLFFLINYSLFTIAGPLDVLSIFFFGLRFDVSAILILNIIFVLLCIVPFRFRGNIRYQKIANIVFVATNSIGFLVSCIDMVYFRFTLKRTAADIFVTPGIGNDLINLIPAFIVDFWYLFLLWFTFIGVLIITVRKIRYTGISNLSKYNYYLQHSLFLIIVVAIVVIGARGGVQLRPLNIISAGKYSNSSNIPLIINTPFSIIKTIGKKGLVNPKYYSNNSHEDYFSAYNNQSNITDTLIKTYSKPNILIIMLESFSSEHSLFLNKNFSDENYQKGYTPFLDSLMKESFVLTNAYANGKRSIEAIPAVFSSLPSLMNDAIISSPYAGNSINSLASLLKPEGYSSSFFHGGQNGTMGFSDYLSTAGFDNYFGREEYNNEDHFDGKWGIYDLEFLQYAAIEINEMNRPFVAGVFTLSSHHPYTIPSEYKQMFPEGKKEIHKSIAYTDFALKNFFSAIDTMPWFNNTLIVICSDHTSEAASDYYKSDVGRYSIPLFFYMKNSKLRGGSDKIAQQLDIMPTVLDLLDFKSDYIGFGKSLFDTTSRGYAVSYLNNTYQLIMNKSVCQFDGEKTTGLYNIEIDSLIENNKLEPFLKAFIQDYNSRMIENRLVVKK